MASYAKNAKDFSSEEIEVLSIIMSFVDFDLPFKTRPSNSLNDYQLQWSPEMILEENDTYGCWSFMSPKKIFARPEECQETSRVFPELSSLIGKRIRSTDVLLKYYTGEKKDRIAFAFYCLENSGHLVSTLLHEMWHHEQFSNNPIKYILSCIWTNIYGYERSLAKEWSIEHDVRKKVDNEKLKERLKELESESRNFVSCLNLYYKPGELDSEKDELRRKMRGMTTIRRIFDL